MCRPLATNKIFVSGALSLFTNWRTCSILSLFLFLTIPSTSSATVFSLPATENPSTLFYQFEIVRMQNGHRTGEISSFKSRRNFLRLDLQPGVIEWRVRWIQKNRKATAWSSWQKYYVPFDDPQILSPVEGEQLRGITPRDTPVTFRWQPLDRADRYRILVTSENASNAYTWLEAKSSTQAIAHLPAGSKYQWKILALTEEEATDSALLKRFAELPSHEFSIGAVNANDEVANSGKTSPSAASSVSTTQPSEFISPLPPGYFVSYRHAISDAQYNGYNQGENSSYNQKFPSAGGDLALGLWKNRWGYMANGSASGLNINGDFYLYNSFGLNLGWRHGKTSEYRRFKTWFGLGYLEFPEFSSSGTAGEFDFHKAQTYGAQAEVSWGNRLKGRLSYELLLRGFYPLGGLNVDSLSGGQTLSAGTQVFFHFNSKWRGFLGYLYRHERLDYSRADGKHSLERQAHNAHMGIEADFPKLKF